MCPVFAYLRHSWCNCIFGVLRLPQCGEVSGGIERLQRRLDATNPSRCKRRGGLWCFGVCVLVGRSVLQGALASSGGNGLD